MWFDIFAVLILAGAVARELTRGGKAISPTQLTWLIATGIVAALGLGLLSRLNITEGTITYIFIVAVVLNVVFIVPAIAAMAVIQSVVSVFLLAFVLQFLPEFVPANSRIYTVIQPIVTKAYVFVKPFIDRYLAYLSSKFVGLMNLDVTKVKPTLPISSGGGIKPTLP